MGNYNELKLGGSYNYQEFKQDEILYPWLNTPYQTNFDDYPEKFSLFIQDKFQYRSTTLIAALRRNGFKSSKYLIANWWPGLILNLNDSWKYYNSPRFSLIQALPMSMRLTFNYGKFYENQNYFSGGNKIYKKKKYEGGFATPIWGSIQSKISLWYAEYKDLTESYTIENPRLGTISFFPDKPQKSEGYDFKLSLQSQNQNVLFQYTWSKQTKEIILPFIGYREIDSSREPDVTYVKTNSDRTHNFLFSYSLKTSNRLENESCISAIGSNLKLNIISLVASGFPYTPIENSTYGEENSKHSPWYFVTNVSLQKGFKVYKSYLNIGMVTYNIFDAKNEIKVWEETGSASNPSDRYQRLIENGSYSSTFFDRPSWYGRRRQIELFIEYAF